jgi:hypothetical protein
VPECHGDTQGTAAGGAGGPCGEQDPRPGGRAGEKQVVRHRPDSGWTVDRFIQIVAAAAGVAAVVLTAIGH